MAGVLEVMRLCGARIGEVASLTGSSVDLVGDTVTFEGKTGPRTLPLLDDARSLLARPDVAADGTLWGAAPSTVERYAWRYLRRALAALEAPAWTPHALRRLWADEADRAGATPVQVAAWLGNSSVTVLRDYRRVQPRELTEVASRMGLVESNVVRLRR